MYKLFPILIGLFLMGCVQPTYKQKVIFQLNASDLNGSKTLGVRGNDSPLSWEKDYPLREVIKDSIYEATVVFYTGYAFTEFKFTIDGNFELQNEDNRRVYFNKKHTTYIKASFNRR